MARLQLTPELIAKMTPEAKRTLRHKCQTDLYFLGKDILGIPLNAIVHGAMCGLFVQKNPLKDIYEQDSVKQRLLLAPRNSMKTTLDQADIVQWILCFPNVRILILTGTQDLAYRMVKELKAHFQLNLLLRALFPELCPVDPEAKWGVADEFTVPRTKNWREPTVSVSTIDSTKAGSHYEILKLDDCVTEVNSRTAEQLKKVVDAFADTTPLMEPQGSYRDYIGTRYDGQDAYGNLLRKNQEAIDEGEEPETKVLILSAWKVKEGRELETNSFGTPVIKADDVELLYPERLGFRWLHKQYREDPYKFSCQQLNNPDPNIEQLVKSFPLDLLLRHKIPYDGMPFAGTKYLCWDLSGYSKTASSDWTVGIVGMVDDQNRLFVIDIIRGKYNPVQQAAAIVEAAKQWKPEVTIIEDAQGARALEPTIVRIAQETQVEVPIRWSTPPRFEGAKKTRIGFLATLLRADRLWFANYVENLKYLFEELTAYPYFRHDDHADALATLVMNLSFLAGTIAPVTSPERVQEIKQQVFYDMLFGDDTPAIDPTPESYDGALGYSLLRSH